MNKKIICDDFVNVPSFELRLIRDHSFAFTRIGRTEDAALILHKILDEAPVEQMVVLYLNQRDQVVGAEKVASGGLECVQVMMRDLFRGSVCACVNSIIIGHNHPSGDCTPSYDDIMMTATAIQIGMLLGISVLDHIIISSNGKHFSVYDNRDRCIKEAHIEKAARELKRMMEIKNPLASLAKLVDLVKI